MTKAIFYTDFHFTSRAPINRLDDFPISQLRKLEEVYLIAKEKKADFVLFGGDFFNIHRMNNYDFIHSLIKIIRNSGFITYAVQGQHDLIGHNKDTYKKSTLCFLENYSDYKFQTLMEPKTIGDMTIHPCHWFDDLNFCCEESRLVKNSYNVLIAHKSITKKKHVFETILTKDIKSNFDLILSGDIHGGHEPHKIKNTTFYNPASLSRMTIKDRNRIPKIGFIEAGKEVEEIFLKNFEKNCFNLDSLNDNKQEETVLDDKFFDEILSLEQESANLKDLISKVALKNAIPDDVLNYINQVMARISEKE